MKNTLTRFDYVNPPLGQPDWLLEVTQSVPDPFDETAVHSRTVGPLTPAQALEQFGLDLADVVEGINTAALTERDALRDALVAEQTAHHASRASAEARLAEAHQTIDALRAKESEQ